MVIVKRFLLSLGMLIIALHSSHAQVERQIPGSQKEVMLSFSPLVKETSPAVVNIYTRRKVSVRKSIFSNDPLFKHFFGDRFGGPATERVESSLGSGVVVDSDGLIVTCHHVIEGSEEVTVVLQDKREFEADVVLLDPKTDLAVLKIDTKGESMPFIPLMDSDEIEVGDLVLALGNPFGIGQTVTSGIVSGLARTTVGVSDYQFFIQTDASINPGNSGGALVNLEGKLAGINSSIYSRSGGSNGVGFAVPSNMVRSVIRSASDQGRVIRPWLGVSMQPVTADIAESLGMDRPHGALVAELDAQGSAWKSGLRVGDVVLRVDGAEISGEHALRYRVATYDLGAKALFEIQRDGELLSVEIPMLAPPEIPERDVLVLEGEHLLAGATVANLSPAVADELGMELSTKGVVVVSRGMGGAAKIGIKTKDIIRAINEQQVTSTKMLEALLASAEAAQSQWKISVERDNRILNYIWRR